jgi:hypothetical protein
MFEAATAGIVAVLATASGPALTSSQVVANGGNTCSGGGKTLQGTVGQAVVGVSGGTSRIVCSGFWCFGGARVLGVDDGSGGGTNASLPKELSFSSPVPNPTHGDSRFTLALPHTAKVSLSVYDVSGRQIGATVSQDLDAGYHQLFWRAPEGHSGVFFIQLVVEGAIKAQRRIVLVR